MGKLLTELRFRDWYDTKFITAFSAFLLYGSEVSVLSVFLGWLFISLNLIIGYTSNNIADGRKDRYVGKVYTTWARGVVLFTVALVAVCACGYLLKGEKALVLVAGCLLLGVSYSFKPIRFKERGFAGVIIGSVSQRVLPVVPLIFSNSGLSAGLVVFLLGVVATGIRAMIVHQIKDYDNDSKSGTTTWVSKVGVDKAVITLERYVVAAEVLAWGAWVIVQGSIYLVLLYLFFAVKTAFSRSTHGESGFGLAGLYYVVIPIYSVVSLGLGNWWVLALLVLVLLNQRFHIKVLTV